MQEIFQIMPKILPIMPEIYLLCQKFYLLCQNFTYYDNALCFKCFMLFSPYYAKNYAGIIDTGLNVGLQASTYVNVSVSVLTTMNALLG